MSDAAIKISDLRKNYPGAFAPALDGLSLEVARGAIFGLLGPNGAGKTTTINILCGLMAPDSGSASIFGLDSQRDSKAIRSRLGVVPQSIALYPALSGWENLMYIGRLYGLNDASIRKRGAELLSRLGLDAHADKRVGRYSGGMKRRANIIASLLHEPELVILDEPTAGVDVQSRAMILDFLKEYRSGGRTIVYTSHHLEEAEQICEMVAIVDEGRYIMGGAPQELIAATPNSHRLEDVFLHYTGHSVRE
jgi:ABC-2 type transport system ATP-binding protein